jgi:hypothetical protein
MLLVRHNGTGALRSSKRRIAADDQLGLTSTTLIAASAPFGEPVTSLLDCFAQRRKCWRAWPWHVAPMSGLLHAFVRYLTLM